MRRTCLVQQILSDPPKYEVSGTGPITIDELEGFVREHPGWTVELNIAGEQFSQLHEFRLRHDGKQFACWRLTMRSVGQPQEWVQIAADKLLVIEGNTSQANLSQAVDYFVHRRSPLPEQTVRAAVKKAGRVALGILFAAVGFVLPRLIASRMTQPEPTLVLPRRQS